jgi:hypothetical protein
MSRPVRRLRSFNTDITGIDPLDPQRPDTRPFRRSGRRRHAFQDRPDRVPTSSESRRATAAVGQASRIVPIPHGNSPAVEDILQDLRLATPWSCRCWPTTESSASARRAGRQARSHPCWATCWPGSVVSPTRSAQPAHTGADQRMTASASRSTCAGSPTVGSRISSSTPASSNAAMTSLIASGERWAPEAIISAVSGPSVR